MGAFNFLFQFSRENGWKSVCGNGILCLKAVKFPLWNNSQLRNVIGCPDCQSTCFHSFIFSFLCWCSCSLCSWCPCFVSYFFTIFFHFFTRMYSYVTLMLLVCTRMWLVCYPYVVVCIRMSSMCTCMYSYVVVCYSYVLVWCFSHDHWLGRRGCRRYLVSVTALTAHSPKFRWSSFLCIMSWLWRLRCRYYSPKASMSLT